MQRHCYKLLIPAGFVENQLIDTEMFIRSWSTERTSDDLQMEISEKLKTVEVIPISQLDYELVAIDNCLSEPTQLELF